MSTLDLNLRQTHEATSLSDFETATVKQFSNSNMKSSLQWNLSQHVQNKCPSSTNNLYFISQNPFFKLVK